jgi:hypothetical protein
MIELLWGLVQMAAYCVVILWGLLACILLGTLGLAFLVWMRR